MKKRAMWTSFAMGVVAGTAAMSAATSDSISTAGPWILFGCYAVVSMVHSTNVEGDDEP